MAVSTGELTLTYGTITIGGSTARQLLGEPQEQIKEEHDFIQGSLEFEFVTTVATDAAFATELDSIRNIFRTPRQDLTITQNTSGSATTILSRKHSDQTGLDTWPQITKDGDEADTARSRHFRVRITYELPADQLSGIAFRRGSTITVAYSPSRRRTVTIQTIYTANSTDGTTLADTQYFNSIAAAETTLLNTVDSTATWERVGQPQVEYFETRKVCRATRVYRELLFNQSAGTLDNANLIDPHMEVTVEQLAPGDSFDGLDVGSGDLGGSASGADFAGTGAPGRAGRTAVTDLPRPSGGTATLLRPAILTIAYDSDIDFGQTTGANKNLLSIWTGTIRPWIIARAKIYSPFGTLVLVDETPAYEDYENHIRAGATFMAYAGGIIRQKVTYDDVLSTGEIFDPVSTKSRFAYYRYPGPATRQMIVTEEREEVSDGTPMRSYVQKTLQRGAGAKASGLDEGWIMISREPKGYALTSGLSFGPGTVTIRYLMIVTVFQFIEEYKPGSKTAGPVIGGALPVATGR